MFSFASYTPRWRLLVLLAFVVAGFLWSAWWAVGALPFDSHASSEPLEYFDNAYQTPLGTLPIDQVHASGFPHKGVIVYVFWLGPGPNIKVLVQRRSAAMVTCPGQWSVMGEHALPGESVRETSTRGLREELGLHVDERSVHVACAYEFHHEFHVRQGLRSDRQLTASVFIVLERDDEPVLRANPSEVSEYAWVSPERMLQMTDAPHDGTAPDAMCDDAVSRLFRDTFIGACHEVYRAYPVLGRLTSRQQAACTRAHPAFED